LLLLLLPHNDFLLLQWLQLREVMSQKRSNKPMTAATICDRYVQF
jgi:hypothetical protein